MTLLQKAGNDLLCRFVQGLKRAVVFERIGILFTLNVLKPISRLSHRAKNYLKGDTLRSRILKLNFKTYFNKPGTAQVGAISKAQKDSKTTFSTTGDNKSSQKTKN